MFQKTQTVLAYLEKEITSGHITGVFPSERALCETHGIGRGAALAIVRALEEKKLLVRQSARKFAVAIDVPNTLEHRKILVVGHPFGLYGWGGAQSDRLLQGVREGAAQYGLECEILVRDHSNLEYSHIQALQNHQYMGVIFLELNFEPTVRELCGKNIPVVIANCENSCQQPCTRMDYRSIGRMAGYELVRAGHRRIGALTGALNQFIFSEMLAGLRGALAEEQVPFDPELVFAMDTFDFKVLDNADYLLNLLKRQDRPTGLFVMRGLRLRPLLEICNRLGIQIPRDLGIICFDEVGIPDAFRNQCGVLADLPFELGMHSVKMLIAWHENGQAPESVILPTHLLHPMPENR